MLILGLGVGTFAVLITFIICLVLFAFLGYLVPRAALYIFLGLMAIPWIVFAIIDSAPRRPSNDALSHIDDSSSSASGSDAAAASTVSGLVVEDTLLPVRIVLLLLLSLGVLGGLGLRALDVLNAPPFTAPTVQCRRKQLEAIHPSWYK